jgi:voltage-gated potassium channel
MRRFKRLPLGGHLNDQPDHELVGVIRMPELTTSPQGDHEKGHRRPDCLLATVLIVYADRNGYRDAKGDGLSFLDSLYYATISLSTTGYGDIAPATSLAHLINVIVITPQRVLFLSRSKSGGSRCVTTSWSSDSARKAVPR